MAESMGDRIKGLRLSRGLTQDDLGKLLGIEGASISQWENDVTKNLRLDNFLRLCAIFKADPYWVVFGTEGDPHGLVTKVRKPLP
jgi:transcriptional regulator with XRE-family HTH domain